MNASTTPGPQEAHAAAQSLFDRHDYNGALSAVNQMLAAGQCPPGTHHLMSICYDRMNLPLQSLQAAEAEFVLNPSFPGTAEQIKKLREFLMVPGTDLPSARPWSTSLDQNGIRHFEICSHRYTYRSIPMSKNAFDLALYPMLLWAVKPRTIIEVGSFYGGSALWMADMVQAWGLDTHTYSVDINKVYTARHDKVTFIQGNGRDLGSVFTEPFLADMPRPLLVIEDADHSYETTTAVMNFFHPRLKNDEYLIIEDVMTTPAQTGRALREFLAAHPSDYVVDRSYCDFFGVNVTWCVNGYLKRVNRPY